MRRGRGGWRRPRRRRCGRCLGRRRSRLRTRSRCRRRGRNRGRRCCWCRRLAGSRWCAGRDRGRGRCRRDRSTCRRRQRLSLHTRQRRPGLPRQLLRSRSGDALRSLALKRGGLLRDGRRQRRPGCCGDRRTGGGRSWRLCSGLSRRRQGLRLATWIGNRHGVCHIADDDRVVDVAVDHIVRWRRCHVSRRTNPHRHRSVHRHRQKKESYGRRRRRQQHEFGRRRCKEDDRWRRRRRERE